MSKALKLELTDDDYQAIERAAQAAGTTPTVWATKVLRDHAPRTGQDAPDPSGSARVDESEYAMLLQQTAQEMAARYGGTPEEHIAAWRARLCVGSHSDLTEGEREQARERLFRHLGVAQSGDPRSADNDRIDEDLAREYAADDPGTT